MFLFAERLERGLDILGFRMEPDVVKKLQVYFDELKKWNAKVNLIAKFSTQEQILEKHFIDSLILTPHVQGEGNHLLDIGSGAGFPGLVCKVACPELEVTLVEPRLKRVSFLKHMVRTLALERIQIAATRIENELEIASDAVYSHITARAVSDIDGFFRMAQPLAASGTKLLCMKGPRWQEELVQAQAVVDNCGYSLTWIEKCLLPFSGAERCLLIFEQQHLYPEGKKI